MAKLIEKSSGNLVDVPDDQALQIAGEGGFLLPRDYLAGDGNVFLERDGKKLKIPAKDVLPYWNEGFRFPQVLSDQERFDAEQREIAKDEIVVPLLTGVGKETLVGPLLSQFSDTAREAQARSAKYNPGLVATGEVATMLGTTLLNPLAGAGKAVAKKTAKEKARDLVTGKFSKELIEAAGGKAAAKVSGKYRKAATQWGVEGLIEGAKYGVKDEIFERSLSNEFVGEDLVTGLLESAASEGAMGLVTGVGLGSLSPLFSSAGNAAAKISKGTINKLGDYVPFDIPRDTKSPKEFFDEIRKSASYERMKGSKKDYRPIQEREWSDPDFQDEFSEWLSNKGILLGTWEEVGGRVREEKARSGEELAGLYRAMDGFADANWIKPLSHKSLLKKLEEAKTSLSDTAPKSQRDAWDDIINRHKRSVIKNHTRSLEKKGMPADFGDIDKSTNSQIDAIYGQIADEADGVGFQSAWDSRIAYDKSGIEGYGESARISQEAAAIYREELERGASRAQKEIGEIEGKPGEGLPDLAELNKEYSFVSTLEDVARNQEATEKTASTLSFKELIATAMLTGTAGPVGAALSVPAILGARYLADKGYDFTYKATKRLGEMFADREIRLKNKINSSVDSILEPKKTRRTTAGQKVRLASISFEQLLPGDRNETEQKNPAMALIQYIRELDQDPTALVDNLRESTAELERVAPGIAAEMAGTEMRKLQFLASKAPRETLIVNKIQPDAFSEYTMDKELENQFKRYIRASVDPTGSLFGEMEMNALTRETVETVSVIYPAIMRRIRTTFLDKISVSDKPIPASKMSQISTLFGEPLAHYQTPNFLRRQQVQYTSPAGGIGQMQGLRKSSVSKGQTQVLTTTNTNAAKANLSSG